AAVRAEPDVAETVSSVDNGESPGGLLSVVLALGRGPQGEFGHWGLGPGAQAMTPPVPPVLEPREDPAGEPSILLPSEDQGPLSPGGAEETPAEPTAPEELIPDLPGPEDASATTSTPAP